MKITSVKIVIESLVETDQQMYPIFRRSSSGNWENLMGESWESYYDSDGELEALYQTFVYKEPPPFPSPTTGGGDE